MTNRRTGEPQGKDIDVVPLSIHLVDIESVFLPESCEFVLVRDLLVQLFLDSCCCLYNRMVISKWNLFANMDAIQERIGLIVNISAVVQRIVL